MKVELIQKPTEDILDKLYIAGRTCYKEGSPIGCEEDVKEIPREKKLKLLTHIIESGHLSVLEHVSFTFAIEGITRACSHQLVRHRMCSFSQQSQRYVDLSSGFDYEIPATISHDEEMKTRFESVMEVINYNYKLFTDAGVPPEDARALLPNACLTNMVVTCNLRELIHLCEERLCTRAQKEIRKMVGLMAKEVTEVEPWLKPYLQPKCERLGYCPETKGCGRKDGRRT